MDPPPVPPGFRLSAANGYALSVFAGQNPKTGGFVLLRVRSPHAQVVYGAPASVTETSIEADLGRVGQINVDFVPSGQARTERSPCTDESLSVDSGSYVGRIDFEGEEGYSDAHATSAIGSTDLLFRLVCLESGSEGSGGHSPGARLTVSHLGTPPLTTFEAMKNSPTRPARFSASIGERRGPLQISRTVEVSAGPNAFDFDVPEGFAHVRPPAPSGRGDVPPRARQTHHLARQPQGGLPGPLECWHDRGGNPSWNAPRRIEPWPSVSSLVADSAHAHPDQTFTPGSIRPWPW